MSNKNKNTQIEPIDELSLATGKPLPPLGKDSEAFNRRFFPATKKELGRAVLGGLEQHGEHIANAKSEIPSVLELGEHVINSPPPTTKGSVPVSTLPPGWN